MQKILEKKPVSGYPLSKKIGLLAGPLLMLLVMWLPLFMPGGEDQQKVIAVTVLMITWWITEAVALPVTALVPLAFFPLLGIADIKASATPYSNPAVFLFMGGFVIALAMERWNLHRRIALFIVMLTGTHANGVVLGFMLATALLSMWISNTATTVMMLPIALSVIGLFLKDTKNPTPGHRRFALSMMLGIAYAANIGGFATLIGTPPNTVFVGFVRDTYGFEVDFARWLLFGLPLSALLLGLVFFILVFLMYPSKLGAFSGSQQVIRTELQKLGGMSRAERQVLVVFLLTAFCWIFRVWLSGLFPGSELSDPAIAMAGAIAMFLMPVNWKKGVFLLQWEDTTRLPWGILLLFGGGLSLAAAMERTGIISDVGQAIAALDLARPWVLVALLTLLILFLTEVMSNLALITVMLPIVAGIAEGIGVSPLLALIPVTVASSCAFMLPMATPPNAIVFASGYIKVSQMAKAGIWLNLLAVLMIIVFSNLVLPSIFD